MTMIALAATLSLGAFAPVPTQPHLAQAWTARSTGDGLPGATGLESYIYVDDPAYKQVGGLRAHLYDYGPSCRKLTINTWKPQRVERTYYMKCKQLNCCYADDDITKKWDLHDSHFLQPVTVKYMGMANTTELDGKKVLAERWHEVDTLPLHSASVTYDYYVTRKGDDVITHRIDYAAEKIAHGSILYGDFKVQHNLTEFAKVFEVPDECKQAIRCPDMVEE